ncbi:MAG: SIS domain-containing protein [Myxococcota bacterium]|nr:SIS domain-containing protein [Myxococcota bacterium]
MSGGKMLEAVRGVSGHLRAGPALAAEAAQQLAGFTPRRVILCGMGGSAFPGELTRLVLDPAKVNLEVSRRYQISGAPLGSEDLVIASSFSGNTEETLSALADAKRQGARRVILCAGGRLEAIARAEGLPLISLERPFPGFQPRAASGYFIGALVGLLEGIGLAPGGAERLAQIADRLSEVVADEEGVRATATEIADQIGERIPVFYAPPPYAETVAQVAKIKINENAKRPAFWNEVPEFNHNEMVGYTLRSATFAPIFLMDNAAPARSQQRMRQSLQTLREAGVHAAEVSIRFGEGDEPLLRALATLYTFDFVSCILAERDGIDPNPVALVEDFKAALGPFELS